jgi:hypothetical protein
MVTAIVMLYQVNFHSSCAACCASLFVIVRAKNAGPRIAPVVVHQDWIATLAHAWGVMGLSQRNPRNRAKSPSVEHSVSPCSTASAAR